MDSSPKLDLIVLVLSMFTRTHELSPQGRDPKETETVRTNTRFASVLLKFVLSIPLTVCEKGCLFYTKTL